MAVFLRRAGLALVVLFACGLLTTALLIDDPYISIFRRRFVIAFLALAALAGAGAAAWRGLRGWRLGGPLALLFLATPVALGCMWLAAVQSRARVLALAPEIGQKLGRHFIIGYHDLRDIETLSARGLIGGLFITHHNLAGRRWEDLRDDIAALQETRKNAGLPPLIIAADQEGGLVSHLSPPLTHFPGLAALSDHPATQRAAAARAQGEAQGRELASLGVTLDLAPVVDLRNARPASALDTNSRINDRAISADPAVVSAVAIPFISGLAAQGVGAVVKHFPGLGRVSEDTHHFRAVISESLEALEKRDWAPFRAALIASPAMLMVGHVVVEALDPKHIASQSSAILNNYIRTKWGYNGPIISDDLLMTPYFRYDACAGVARSLNAGVDLLLVAFDGRHYDALMECLVAAARENRLSADDLAKSAARLDKIAQ